MKTKQELEGIKAFREGKSIVDNPHHLGSYGSNLWKNGWLNAQRIQSIRELIPDDGVKRYRA